MFYFWFKCSSLVWAPQKKSADQSAWTGLVSQWDSFLRLAVTWQVLRSHHRPSGASVDSVTAQISFTLSDWGEATCCHSRTHRWTGDTTDGPDWAHRQPPRRGRRARDRLSLSLNDKRINSNLISTNTEHPVRSSTILQSCMTSKTTNLFIWQTIIFTVLKTSYRPSLASSSCSKSSWLKPEPKPFIRKNNLRSIFHQLIDVFQL